MILYCIMVKFEPKQPENNGNFHFERNKFFQNGNSNLNSISNSALNLNPNPSLYLSWGLNLDSIIAPTPNSNTNLNPIPNFNPNMYLNLNFDDQPNSKSPSQLFCDVDSAKKKVEYLSTNNDTTSNTNIDTSHDISHDVSHDITHEVSHDISRECSNEISCNDENPDGIVCNACTNFSYNVEELSKIYAITDINSFVEKTRDMEKEDIQILAMELYNIIIQFKRSKNKIQEPISPSSRTTNPTKFMSVSKFLNSSKYNIKHTNTVAASNTDSSTENLAEPPYYLKINEYTLYNIIGSGTQGTVFYALKNKEEYAVKIISRFSKTLRFSMNTKNEIEVMKKLDNKNVIKLQDVIFNKNNDNLYLIMQYAHKGQIIKKENGNYKKLSRNKVVNYGLQIMNGIKYLHDNNIIHNDIKPENILLDKNDNVYISDFGVSEIIDNSFLSLRAGTFLYFSPEKFLIGDKIYGEPIDIWAFGVTLYIMLYGCFPYNGKNYKEIKYNVLNEKTIILPEMTKTEIDLFEKIFNKDPVGRIKLEQIMNHDFFTKNLPNIPSFIH